MRYLVLRTLSQRSQLTVGTSQRSIASIIAWLSQTQQYTVLIVCIGLLCLEQNCTDGMPRIVTIVYTQKRRAIEALEARAPQTVWRLWLIVYRTKLKVSLCA